MMKANYPPRSLPLLALLACTLMPGSAAASEAGVMMSGARVRDEGTCSFLTVMFTGKIQLREWSAGERADELHIKLAPLVGNEANGAALVDQESLHAPSSEQAAVHAIELAYDPAGALLSVYFRRQTVTKVVAGSHGKSLVIGIAATGRSEPCEPSPESSAELPPDTEAVLATSDQRMNAIRNAITAGDTARAAAMIGEASRAHDPRYAQELDELSAVVLEQSGQHREALEAYRRYLEHYPSGPGAERVRTKLKALEATPQAQQNAAISGFVAPAPKEPGKAITDGAIPGGPVVAPVSGGANLEKQDPDAWKISQSGSTSLFYYRNEGGRDVFVPPRLQLGWDKESVYKLYQNSFVGTLDYNARFERGPVEGRMRVSTAHDQDFIDAEDSESSFYAANLSLEDKLSGTSAIVGRQTLYTGGVLGRFDGALASFKAVSNLRLTAVAGAPVWRGGDAPFRDATFFYGAGASLDDVKLGGTDVDPAMYYFHQDSSGIIDREAVGASLSVRDDTSSLFALADYDIHYGKLNNVSLMATYMFANQSLLGFNADYRRAPLVFTTNALQGQPVATLSDLLKIYTHAEVEQYALDRTANSFTVDVNYTLPIGENWQLTADFYLSYMGGTIESGNVPAMEPTGTDYYAFAQLTRTNLLATGDSHSAALRLGDTAYDNLYAVELTSRYPLNAEWSAGPSIRAGFSDSKTSAADEVQFMPSLHLAYRITEDVTLDMEAGKKWLTRDTVHGTERETELMALAGIRYDFYTK